MDFDSLFRSMSGLGGLISGMVSIPFIIVALVLVVIALRGRSRASTAKSWPQAAGRVVSAEIETRRNRSSNGGTSITHYPRIIYEYQVDGRTYRGDRFNLAEIGRGNIGAVQRDVDKYPPGSSIMVYYNPADPYESVINPTAPSSKMLLWVAAIIILMLACSSAMTAGGFALVQQITNQFMSGIPR